MASAADILSSENSNTTPSAHLQQLFDQHLKILKEHLDLCSALKEYQSAGSHDQIATQACLDRTQEMIRNFRHLTTSYENAKPAVISPRSAQLSPGAKRAAPPVDALANPVDDIQSPQSAKKRRLGYDTQTDTPFDLTLSFKDRITISSTDSKQSVLDEQPSSKPAEQVRSPSQGAAPKLASIGQEVGTTGTTAASSESTKVEAVTGQLINEHQLSINGVTLITQSTEIDDGQSFLEKVKKHHQQKEDQRKKKLDKKRKRTSQASVGSQDAQDMSNPKRKKQRGNEPQSRSEEVTAHQEELENTSKKRGTSLSRDRSKRQRTG